MKRLTGWLARLPKPLRWILVALIGSLLIVMGLIMLVTPGPGILFLFLGISVLALEIEWARELHKQGMQGLEWLFEMLKQRFRRRKGK
ncbi:MAG: hypothetical protein RLZZ600_741 [Actinomycetota bacterium]